MPERRTPDAPPAPKIDTCDPESRDSHHSRCTWVKDNPDIAAFLHALRVELLVHYLMRRIVADDDAYPFHYWLRFEFGTSGNPHAHGLNYVAGNPTFDNVVADEETKARLQDFFDDLQPVDEGEERLANFFDPYVQEMHPAKDEGGEQLYDFVIENMDLTHCKRPQAVNLREILDETFRPEADARQKLTPTTARSRTCRSFVKSWSLSSKTVTATRTTTSIRLPSA